VSATSQKIAAAHNEVRGRGSGVKSVEAQSLVRNLLEAPPLVRRKVLSGLPSHEMRFILLEAQRETGSVFGLWHDTPSGFIEDVIGETVWSRQRMAIDAITSNTIVVVPAGFGVGKTWVAGRLTAWMVATNPIGTALVVTLAPRFRQVRNQLWPHIRTAVAKGNLPGRCDTVQWKAETSLGVEKQVAYGFSAPENDESAMQGIHGTPKLLLIVDEAGGIPKSVGAGTNNLLTGDSRLLAIGNPATDDQGGWFETIANKGYDGEPGYCTIQIATTHSPGITGEVTPRCKECPPESPVHPISIHLPGQKWMDDTIAAYGDDHPYVIAKVRAEFPKDSSALIIPISWVEAATQVEDPEGDGYVRPCDLGLEGEDETFKVRKGSWVRLGVDVAADGGDEFAIYRAIGDTVAHRHTSAGAANDNAVTVAQVVLEHIHAAEKLAAALESKSQIRVKIDSNGLGWGVYGMLKTWGEQGKHSAAIVGVNVSENTEADDEAAAMRPFRKRDEMWLGGRILLQPDPKTGEGRLRLRLDEKAAKQLTIPKFSTNSGGFVVVESKANMKKRGRNSPDRAEAALLAIYEPFPVRRNPRRGIIAGA